MIKKKYKYIYGPVNSWRLGASLGIDPVVKDGKVCSFDCLYCQIGRTKELTAKRDVFVSKKELMDEIRALPKVHIDYITFAGTGEPTLAANLRRMIKEIRKERKEKIAIITNASLFGDKRLREDIRKTDFVLAKLDAPDSRLLKIINRPAKGIKFESILRGMKVFAKEFKGRFGIQIMFLKQNKGAALRLARLVRTIKPDEVEINTPLRPCGVKPLGKSEIAEITRMFRKELSGTLISVTSVYEDKKKREVRSISSKDTIKRRGKPV